jgi:hypothetical protein
MSTIRTASMRARGGSTSKRGGGLAAPTQRQNFFRSQQEVLVEGVGGYLDFEPLTTAGDNRERSASRIGDPHVVLDLGHMLLGGGLFRERPGQHEFGLENRSAARNNPVESRAHPPEHGMQEPMLDAFDAQFGVGCLGLVRLLSQSPPGAS